MNEQSVTIRKSKELLELHKGESLHSKGGYQFRWTDEQGGRHSVHAKTLEELREKEKILSSINGIMLNPKPAA